MVSVKIKELEGQITGNPDLKLPRRDIRKDLNQVQA